MAKRKVKFAKRLKKLWHSYEYKHTTAVLVFIGLFVIFFDSVFITSAINSIIKLGYLGAFLSGVLSVTFITTAPAVVLMIDFANSGLEPYFLALVIAVGSTFGDYVILKLYQDHVIDELKPLLRKIKLGKLLTLLRHRYTSWVLFLVGAGLIATPLPDEIGLSLMGISHIKRRYILFICFLLNYVGTLAFILAVKLISD